ncbi:MAG: HAD family hydrolase [Prochlorococcus sp.]|jgi:HAD superfamily hydrolase (TIGR01509 family)|nr:HAD family phosphatase [Prochlorococcaceae cyanobacterium ETNP2_MAG_10]MDP6196266.1 HAD family phosphatase [Prochlorococcaceae cyanobacterium ETNP18_MAG_17]MDP6321081.1 HAD family phosphatase [Prochlorococcaceae cyanobacterium ETNP14_MAG_5]|tara:strand:+ start:398 stop:1078 length:681 start_codon:yes stop_codon:yes gene_type:complete
MHLPAACLFDLDGLLLDTEPLHAQAWSETADFFGTSLSRSQLITLKGRRRLDCAEQINNWLDSPVGNEQLLAVRQPIAKQLLSQAKAMPGAEELVRWCDDNKLPMALVSSSTSDAVAFKSLNHSWLALIQTRVLGDDPSLKAGKPAPDPFLLAAKRLAVKPSTCWALEDSQAGSRAALAAGCQVWLLNNEQEACLNSDKSPSNKNPRRITELKTVLEYLHQVKDAL